MPILKSLTWTQRAALALFLGACVFALLSAVLPNVGHAEVLQCWPAHTPTRAGFEMDPALLGLLCAVAAIFFI